MKEDTLGKWLSPAPQEDIEEAIEKLANLIVRKYRMGTVASIALEGSRPLAPMVKTMAWFQLTPYVPMIGAVIDNADASFMKYLDILETDENMTRLIQRIKELQEEVDKEKILGKEEDEKERHSALARFMALFRWLPR